MSEKNLESLQENGFIIIKKALDKDQVSVWKEKIYSLYNNQKYEINNTVGKLCGTRGEQIDKIARRSCLASQRT